MKIAVNVTLVSLYAFIVLSLFYVAGYGVFSLLKALTNKGDQLNR